MLKLGPVQATHPSWVTLVRRERRLCTLFYVTGSLQSKHKSHSYQISAKSTVHVFEHSALKVWSSCFSAMSLNEEFYTGFWTNWAMGRVAGATLTLSRRDGAYLIAFLALFVHVVGACFWRITSFAVFRAKARPSHEDNLELQQQTILRNSASAISGFRGFLKIFIRSKKLERNVLLIAWSILNFVGFLAAGILSSKVTSTRSDVLLQPTHCGRWWDSGRDATNERDVVQETTAIGEINMMQGESCKRASICYGGHNTISNSCNNPGRRALSWQTNESSTCPFGDLCTDKTLSMDSGFVDSDLDLGINSHASDRISLRLRLQCAPLKQDDYMKTYFGADVSSLFSSNPSWDAKFSFGEQTKHFGYEGV